jgi:hypothetical protein
MEIEKWALTVDLEGFSSIKITLKSINYNASRIYFIGKLFSTTKQHQSK